MVNSVCYRVAYIGNQRIHVYFKTSFILMMKKSFEEQHKSLLKEHENHVKTYKTYKESLINK